jgi:hypothetical protein
MTVNGIDVSAYQNSTYSTAGLGFVIVKATEGTSYVNPAHAAQIQHGRDAHLVPGHYHFVRPGDMKAQADFFLQHAAPGPGDVLAFDWEDKAVSGGDKDVWLKYVQAKAPTHRVLLYCDLDFWTNRDHTGFTADGLWIADPSSPAGHPAVKHAWVMHQYSSSGGIDHNVAAFADTAALRTWAAKGTPAVQPHPQQHQPFPGASWFTTGRRSPIVAAMHDRLVAVGCNHYTSNANKDVIGSGDVASYQAWQHKLGYTGPAAVWPPGQTSWDKLQIPKVAR